ncbi:lipopolysaccharide biosynthesis protein [Chitinophaga agri]|uniref:Oligosaccharide flippase family protein n=1 Tax=Chitinophaga agri TaxID=2703787 RepID=A0A6B9ZLJ8_9BACT|nr:oligosaccharide flippase family protein [Chitinophaga agri]QHS61995.1 oligosaccharide flippase family protein [Chitinophaga agri]
MNILKHPLFQKSIIYTITDAINKAIPFLLLPFLTHYLSPADYGTVANYNVYISVILIFTGLNLNGAMATNFYKFSKQEVAEYVSNIFVVMICAAVLVTLLMAAGAPYVSSLTSILPFFLVIGVSVAVSQGITAVNLDLWRLEEKPLWFGGYQIVQSLMNVGLTVIFLALLKMGADGRMGAMAITSVVFALVSIAILYKRGYLKLRLNRAYLRDALGFGLPMIPHTLGIWIRTGIDRIYITKFYGVAEAGLYSTGFQFGLLLSFLVMAFHNAYVPFVYKRLALNEEEQKLKLVKMTYIYMMMIIALAFIFSFVSYFVISHLLSDKYLDSSKYIVWAMFTQAFQGMYLIVGVYIFYTKKTAKLAIVTSSLSVLQLVLSYILVKFVGPMGAAYSGLAVSILNFVIVWVLSMRVFPMPWLKFKIFKA